VALLTNLCLFDYGRDSGRFRLRSVHPGHTLEEVRDLTGFDFDAPAIAPITPEPAANQLALLRGPVAEHIAEVYPAFAQQVFGIARTA
jgi:glutaconate CoA-transferase subunit B